MLPPTSHSRQTRTMTTLSVCSTSLCCPPHLSFTSNVNDGDLERMSTIRAREVILGEQDLEGVHRSTRFRSAPGLQNEHEAGSAAVMLFATVGRSSGLNLCEMHRRRGCKICVRKKRKVVLTIDDPSAWPQIGRCFLACEPPFPFILLGGRSVFARRRRHLKVGFPSLIRVQ